MCIRDSTERIGTRGDRAVSVIRDRIASAQDLERRKRIERGSRTAQLGNRGAQQLCAFGPQARGRELEGMAHAVHLRRARTQPGRQAIELHGEATLRALARGAKAVDGLRELHLAAVHDVRGAGEAGTRRERCLLYTSRCV